MLHRNSSEQRKINRHHHTIIKGGEHLSSVFSSCITLNVTIMYLFINGFRLQNYDFFFKPPNVFGIIWVRGRKKNPACLTERLAGMSGNFTTKNKITFSLLEIFCQESHKADLVLFCPLTHVYNSCKQYLHYQLAT